MNYYVTSDLHSFGKPFKKALRQAGYKRSDKNNTLIICGDLFDRGEDTLEIYKYIKRIPKANRVLIQGNHELLYLELLDKPFPDKHDFHNGTVKTFCQIAEVDPECLERHYWFRKYYHDLSFAENKEEFENQHEDYLSYKNIESLLVKTWKDIREKVKKHPITKWLKSDEWKNYYELDKYIFVHSFIPIDLESDKTVENWRTEAFDVDWEVAKWGCPWKWFLKGNFSQEIENGKVLVCGHWHAADFHKMFENDDSWNNTIYRGKNLIALDACTAATDFTNVLRLKNLRKESE